MCDGTDGSLPIPSGSSGGNGVVAAGTSSASSSSNTQAPNHGSDSSDDDSIGNLFGSSTTTSTEAKGTSSPFQKNGAVANTNFVQTNIFVAALGLTAFVAARRFT